MMMTPVRTRSVADHRAYYKRVPSKVDCRWKAGTPRIRKGSWVEANRRVARRNTEGVCSAEIIEWQQDDANNACCDDVFEEKLMEAKQNSIEEDEHFVNAEQSLNTESINITTSPNNATSTSIESVSDHFHQLFDQLEGYMKNAPDLDCIFIRRRIDKMKDGMQTINYMFDEVLDTGSRLERFLEERQNNNNIKKVCK